jgi:hypothetical protein
LNDEVECYSGVEYAERPRKFLWRGKWRTVDRIQAERRTPEGKQFEVQDEEQEKFILAYETGRDTWTIHPLP